MSAIVNAGLLPEVTSNLIRRVWWPVNIDMAIEDGKDGDEFVAKRIQYVLDQIGTKASERFPNADDWDIAETDRFSPRCETEDGREYEGFYDMFHQWEDTALGEAMEKWPFADDDNGDDDSDEEMRTFMVIQEGGWPGCTDPDYRNTNDGDIDDSPVGVEDVFETPNAGCDWCGVNDRIAGSKYCFMCDHADKTFGLGEENIDIIDSAVAALLAGSDAGVCDKCHGSGFVSVSYASAENGPTDDPADEFGRETCECEIGQRLWREAHEATDRWVAAMYATDKQPMIEYLLNEKLIDQTFATENADQDIVWWQNKLIEDTIDSVQGDQAEAEADTEPKFDPKNPYRCPNCDGDLRNEDGRLSVVSESYYEVDLANDDWGQDSNESNPVAILCGRCNMRTSNDFTDTMLNALT